MRKIVAALGAVALLVLTGCSSIVPAPLNPQPAATVDVPDFPDGYEDTGAGLAFKWLEQGDPNFDCGYYDRCVVVEFYAYENCTRGVYVEANILNDGTVVDWTNGTISSLSRGEKGVVTLGKVGPSRGSTYKLTDVSCR